jgi:chemotaxis protein MotB
MTQPRLRTTRSRVSHDRWLISYADFITLLFALFVVLFAFAKADQKKQIQVAAAITGAFHEMGVFTGSASSEQASAPTGAVMTEEIVSTAKVKDDLDQMRHELEKTLSKEIEKKSVSIEMTREGLVISLREAGFFASGSATPKPESVPVLRQIAEKLGRSPYDMRVEGHTDNIPIHTAEFDSNWELSSLRATRIARIFLDLQAIPPERISAAGFAEFHPVASNDTEDGRAKNRRVDLVILPRTKMNFAGAEYQHPSGVWHKITDDDQAAPPPTPKK